MRICGDTTGNMTFVSATRPNKASNSKGFECPSNYMLCSNFTNASTSFCVQNMDDCPVTDIKFVPNAQVINYNTNPNDFSTPQYLSQVYTSTVTLMWSNQVNSMPITTFEVASKPCMNPQD